MSENGNKNLEVATLGGGCFWCLEPIFLELAGVTDVVSGYSGGQVGYPSYAAVCTGQTGHAEVIQITFDPRIISYRDLLAVFLTYHDPTTLNRQGNDVGTQYRSVIFYHDEEQRADAEEVVRAVEEANVWERPIVTEITPFERFYPAEGYHQEYFYNNPGQGYCRIIIAPKVAKFRKEYADRLKQ
ncbi:MAG: peptide-methionine (S)-S-oxide reductase MsrA [Caldilineaceae bacterium]|nr:peptide-methionine (S)-S-oxide reductase MsrA [Caldilineaceae bacterium]